ACFSWVPDEGPRRNAKAVTAHAQCLIICRPRPKNPTVNCQKEGSCSSTILAHVCCTSLQQIAAHQFAVAACPPWRAGRGEGTLYLAVKTCEQMVKRKGLPMAAPWRP